MSKKGKKWKGRTLDLNDFMSENGSPVKHGFQVVQTRDDILGSNVGAILLPTAPISSRGSNVDESKVPKEPPFSAFIGNLPFEIVEEDVASFFNELKLTSVRLARDGAERLRGFGYADFEDRSSLIAALGLDGEQLRGREVRVSLPDNDDGRGGFGRDRGMRSGFGSRSERPIERDLPSDWRAAARDEQTSRGFDSYSRGNRDGGGGGGFGDRDYDRGGNDSKDWRNEGRSGSSRYEPPRDRTESPSIPSERPKLKIAPRTKEIEPIKVTEIDDPEAEKKAAAEKKPEVKVKIEKPKAADIFGAAKPVDTAAKLEEIEKRLEAKQKVEMEQAKVLDKAAADQQGQSSSKETSPRHGQSNEEPVKKWRDEIRDERDKKEQKQRSERRAPAQVLEEPSFNPTSKNKYAGLEVSDNQDESDAEDGIQAEN